MVDMDFQDLLSGLLCFTLALVKLFLVILLLEVEFYSVPLYVGSMELVFDL
jgi:hypothetical protein